MGRELTLITIEGLEHPGFCGLVGRLSNKFKKKGHDSAFGFEPENAKFCNYFRPPTQQNSDVLVKFAERSARGSESGGVTSRSPGLEAKLREVVDKIRNGDNISSRDLVFLSFFERRIHLGSILKSGVFSKSFVVLKGYELSVFAEGICANIPFEELLQIRDLVLGDYYVSPDITIIFNVPGESSRLYLEQRGVNLAKEYLEELGLSYEKAIARLQGGSNYGFVVRVKGDKSEGVVFADILYKLGHYIPAFR